MTGWVLHDYLQVNGGAERLVVTLAAGLGFRLGVSGIYADFSGTGNLQGLTPYVPRLPTLPRVARALAAFGGARFPIKEASSVIYSGLYAPLAVHRQREGRRIYYCHTPPRFAFGEGERYRACIPEPLRPAFDVAAKRYGRAYRDALARMDAVIANSANTQRKLQTLGIASRIIYPPVDTDGFVWRGQGDYYLSLGRLEPNKRIDRIVAAFRQMPDRKLVVASGGSQYQTLLAQATDAPHIEILGWQDEASLRRLVGGAIATLYIPRDEDFGMSAVEAMAAGKPVIAADEGGLRESVLNGETGLLIAPDVPAITAAVQNLPPERAALMRGACEAQAAPFSHATFIAKFNEVLQG
jgi:glycosyltransferase involved in cell wall biosynthesis